MQDRPLVSLITYCYNGERFVSKYFEAVLAQTYDNIELIFFNNGSDDRTGKIAEGYRSRLEEKCAVVHIIHYEENQCTCELKKKGIDMMKGEYFLGCDSDDLLDPTHIEEMTAYLQAHPEKGIVYCQLRSVEEETGKQRKIIKMKPRYEHHEAFKDILLGTNIIFTSIGYMMSRAHFLRVNPKMEIYPSRYGENYQLQIPFLYYDLQGYIEKPLGQYTVRKDSYTGQLDTKKKVVALKEQEYSVLSTLKLLPMEDYDHYSNFFLKRIRKERYYTTLLHGDKALIKESYGELKEVKGTDLKSRVFYILDKCGISYAKLKR